jgi:hypothetical protein
MRLSIEQPFNLDISLAHNTAEKFPMDVNEIF